MRQKHVDRTQLLQQVEYADRCDAQSIERTAGRRLWRTLPSRPVAVGCQGDRSAIQGKPADWAGRFPPRWRLAASTRQRRTLPEIVVVSWFGSSLWGHHAPGAVLRAWRQTLPAQSTSTAPAWRAPRVRADRCPPIVATSPGRKSRRLPPVTVPRESRAAGSHRDARRITKALRHGAGRHHRLAARSGAPTDSKIASGA